MSNTQYGNTASVARSETTQQHEQIPLSFNAFYKTLIESTATNTTNEQHSPMRMFERGDYYTLHGDDALYVAETVFNTTSVLKYYNKDSCQLPYVTLSRVAGESLIHDVLKQATRLLQVWRNDAGEWKCVKSASPGNVQDFEDLFMLDDTVAPVVMCIKLSQNSTSDVSVGVAFADASHRELGVSQFIDNDLFSNLESMLVQLAVKECLVETIVANGGANNYQLTKLISVIERCDVLVTRRSRADFNAGNVEGDLHILLAKNTDPIDPESQAASAQALACLFKYLRLTDDIRNAGQYRLIEHKLSQFMRLDASAVKALSLMPSATDGANKIASLMGLLNKCRTAQGMRLLSQWLRQPLLDYDSLMRRQGLVEIVVNDCEFRQVMQDEHLKNVPDLSRLSKKFQRGKAGLQDVVRLYDTIVHVPDLLNVWQQFCSNASQEAATLWTETFWTPMAALVPDLEKLCELIQATVDLNAAQDHEFIINPIFDESLTALRYSMNELLDQMQPEQERVAEDLGMEMNAKLKMDKNNQYGYFFRIARADAGVLSKKGGKYQELTTQKSGVFFTTPKLREISKELLKIITKYEELQASLVKEITDIVKTYCPVLELLNDAYSHLDVITSLAQVAMHAPIPYVKPVLHRKGEGDLVLTGSRHPCLEVQADMNFIANDVEMKRDDSKFLILTGPNMGGKSTYLRQIGMIVLMAQIGSFVPCTHAEMPLFDSVLARVGAGDSQLKGVSTFMAEMLETATILKSATKGSLIIIDELGTVNFQKFRLTNHRPGNIDL